MAAIDQHAHKSNARHNVDERGNGRLARHGACLNMHVLRIECAVAISLIFFDRVEFDVRNPSEHFVQVVRQAPRHFARGAGIFANEFLHDGRWRDQDRNTDTGDQRPLPINAERHSPQCQQRNHIAAIASDDADPCCLERGDIAFDALHQIAR